MSTPLCLFLRRLLFSLSLSFLGNCVSFFLASSFDHFGGWRYELVHFRSPPPFSPNLFLGPLPGALPANYHSFGMRCCPLAELSSPCSSLSFFPDGSVFFATWRFPMTPRVERPSSCAASFPQSHKIYLFFPPLSFFLMIGFVDFPYGTTADVRRP